MADLSPGLLPEGLRDRLPPQAEAAMRLMHIVIRTLSARGYEYVMPPLAEFEANLVGRLKSIAGGRDLLRFTDPVSQRTLALRPDITAQIGRIATTRMAHIARPLRLSYGGPVLRVRGRQLDLGREALQTGAELVGSDHVTAVIELINVALETIFDGIADPGLRRLTVDLTLPDLVQTLAAGPLPLASDALDDIQQRLDAKDAGAACGSGYEALLRATGPADDAIATLKAAPFADFLASRIAALEAVIAAIRDQARATGGDVTVTLDPTERHGFEFQSWIGFSIFADGIPGEIARGGAYAVIHPDGREEPAVGFSLFIDPLIDAGVGVRPAKRCFVPLGTARDVQRQIANGGEYAAVLALGEGDSAQSLRCTHHWTGSGIEPLVN